MTEALHSKLFGVILVLSLLLQNCQLKASRIARQQCAPMQKAAISILFNSEVDKVFRRISLPQWAQDDLKYVSCLGRGLTAVPQYLERDIQILSLRGNMITYFGPMVFARYPELVAIDLEENCATNDLYNTVAVCSGSFVLDDEAFAMLDKLKYLDLSANSGSIPNFPSRLPTSLVVIYSSYSAMHPIPSDRLRRLRNLKVFHVSSNCRMVEPTIFCKGSFTIKGQPFVGVDLEYLDLAFNNWTAIPTNFLTENLKVLRIRANPIRVLRHDDFANSPNITFLFVSFVSQYDFIPLRIIGNPFSVLIELQHLDLSGNMLRSVPTGFLATNQKLQSLILQLNCFKTLATNPVMIPPLPKLKSIDLSANTLCSKLWHPVNPQQKLLKLGNWFKNFPNLESIALGPRNVIHWQLRYLSYGTKYQEVNESSFRVLESMPHLSHLNIAYCGVIKLNTSAWARLPRLSFVDARINQIGEKRYKPNSYHKIRDLGHTSKNILYTSDQQQSFQSNIFAKTLGKRPAGSTLILRRNSISDIRRINFEHCTFVKFLDLSYNQINYIYSDTFRPMSLLNHIDLRWNPIRHIADSAFQGLAHFTSLQINVTIYENDLTLEFVKHMSRPGQLELSGMDRVIYYLFHAYNGRTNVRFDNVLFLSLSSNHIPVQKLDVIDGLLAVFPNLIKLTMTDGWLHLPLGRNLFNGISNLRYLDLSRNGMQLFPAAALSRLPQLEVLNISYNGLTEVPSEGLHALSNLKYLILSHNKLKDIYSLHKLPRLYHLSIRNNEISDIGPRAINRTFLQRLKFLDLRYNNFLCECSLSTTFGWMANLPAIRAPIIYHFYPFCSSALQDYNGGCVVCQSGPNLISLLMYSTSHACEFHWDLYLCLSVTTFVAAFTSWTLFLYSKSFKKYLVALVHRNIRYSDACERENWNSKSDESYEFDAFVCHDHTHPEMGNWVQKCLLPQLECEHPRFKVCVSGRDDYCGTTQVVQLLMKIKASRNTILVVNREFATSPKCRYVLSALENWFYLSGVDHCVLVAFDRNETGSLPLYIDCNGATKRKRNMFIVPEEDDDLHELWEALKTCLVVGN